VLKSDVSFSGPNEQHHWHCQDREDEFATRRAFLQEALAAPSANGGDDRPYRDMLTQVMGVVQQVHQQGYVVIPDLMGSNALERLRRGLTPLLELSSAQFKRLASKGLRSAFHIHNALAKTRAADEVALHPIVRAAMGGILGFDFIFHAGAIVTAHSPGCQEQPLHRDDASFYALPRPRMPLVITAAIALDDFTRANGATRVAPGSCWWERKRQPVESEIVAVEMTAGSVLIWDGAIFHGGGANVTHDKSRRTLFLNYTRGWLRTQFNQFLVLPREVVLSLPAELQRDLGYARSLRALGECDGHEPLAYLQAILRQGDGVQPSLGPETSAAS
jgi:ectoine hydroxylase-related dioxygenase (phytanoyl-CoA dioxygenase family)